jgi:hypothetical protein
VALVKCKKSMQSGNVVLDRIPIARFRAQSTQRRTVRSRDPDLS